MLELPAEWVTTLPSSPSLGNALLQFNPIKILPGVQHHRNLITYWMRIVGARTLQIFPSSEKFAFSKQLYFLPFSESFWGLASSRCKQYHKCLCHWLWERERERRAQDKLNIQTKRGMFNKSIIQIIKLLQMQRKEANLCEYGNQWACSSSPCSNLVAPASKRECQAMKSAFFDMPFLSLRSAPVAFCLTLVAGKIMN